MQIKKLILPEPLGSRRVDYGLKQHFHELADGTTLHHLGMEKVDPPFKLSVFFYTRDAIPPVTHLIPIKIGFYMPHWPIPYEVSLARF